MQWVSKPRRVGEDWMVCVESPAGLSQVSLVEALPRYSEAEDGLIRHQGTLFLESLKPACAQEYFAATGLRGSEDHQVFTARVGGVDCVVPALTVSALLFKSLRQLVPHLGRPAALDNLVLERISPSDHRQVVVWKTCGLRGRNLSDQLAWLIAFPSARHAWHTLGQNLNQGRIALIPPPEGQLTVRLRGIQHNGRYFVAKANAVSHTTSERGFGMSSPCSSSFHFRHSGATLKSDTSPGFFRGALPLSDDEWALVRHLIELHGYDVKGGNYRPVVDALLRMFVLRKRWSKADFDSCSAGHAHYMYICWRKDGLWDEIVGALRQHAFEQNTINPDVGVERVPAAL